MFGEHSYFEKSDIQEDAIPDIYKHLSRIYDKFIKSSKKTNENFYQDDVEVEQELSFIQSQLELYPKNENLLKRIYEIKRIIEKRKWIDIWFKNTYFSRLKQNPHNQYIIHLNPIWYWDWWSQTIFCDTIFINFYEGVEKPIIKRFNMLFNIDHANKYYEQVKSKKIITKLDGLVPSNPLESF